MAKLQTIVQNFILVVSLVAGFFLITSLFQQDWMQEDVSMRIPKEIINSVKNLSSSMLPPGESTSKQQLKQMFNMIDTIPSDMAVEMNLHCGLQQTCLMLTVDGFENPIKLFIPKIKWCYPNDVYLNPSKYGLPVPPESTLHQNVVNQFKALGNARLCVILAIFCVAVTIAILHLKVKWQKESVLSTAFLVLISCICIVGALGFVSCNFAMKKNYEHMKKYTMDSGYNKDLGYGGRGRRNSPGYGEKYSTESHSYGRLYPKEDSQRGAYTPFPDFSQWDVKKAGGDDTGLNNGGTMDEATGEMVMKMLSTLKIKESVGSPLIMAGLSVGFLLLATILNGVEFYLIRKYGGMEVKYQNVEMS